MELTALLPLIHSSIFHRLSVVGSWWQQTKQGGPNLLLPSYFIQLFLGGGACPASSPVLPTGYALNTSPGRCPGAILTWCPSQLWLFSNRRSSGSTLSSSRITEPLTLSLRNSPSPCLLRESPSPCHPTEGPPPHSADTGLSNVAESCQPPQPYNIQSLKELQVDLIHPR